MSVPRSAFRVPGNLDAPCACVQFRPSGASTRNSELGTRNLITFLLVTALLLAPPVSAQQSADSLFRRSSPVVVKYGKWVVLAAALGMGLKASSAHHDADRAFARLERYCGVNPNNCAQLPSGSYSDPVAEGYYKASLQSDRRARGWLLGGEAALVGAAGLFVWELTRPRSLPKNIPFEPEVRWTGRETTVGGRVRF
jgi:hypothetical protein